MMVERAFVSKICESFVLIILLLTYRYIKMISDTIEWKTKKKQNLHVEVDAVLFQLRRVKCFCREFSLVRT